MIPKKEFKLSAPLPKYRSTEALVKELIEYITNSNFEVGHKFLSDKDLVLVTGRSRTAVRRALDILQKEGWISRYGGKGTFIGERLSLYNQNIKKETFSSEMKPGNLDIFSMYKPVKIDEQATIRIAVVVSSLVSGLTQKHSWYHGEILEGVDEATAAKNNVIVEFLGCHGAKLESLLPRLERNRPDVFLCIGPPLNHVALVGIARQLKIPCALAAVRAPELGIPNFYEDSVAASCDAVKYLTNLGHRRIGFAQIMSPSGWWAFDRYEGYLQGLRETEAEHGGFEGLWLPILPTRDSVTLLKRYIKKNKLTAIISGSYWVMGHLAELAKKEGMHIPDDLSCMTFDQNPVVRFLLGGLNPTTIYLPWKELGKAFVRMVMPLINHEEVPDMAFPCTIVEGDTVKRL